MIPRTLNLSKLLGNFSSAFLLGARGTGKTFLSREFMKGRRGLTYELLKGETFTRYLVHPEYFRKEIEQELKDDCLTVYVDEIQKLPRLLDEVHQLLSDHERRVRFLLTGSSARKLKRTGANMLAGRAYSAFLFPLTFLEQEAPLEQLLQFGSLPGIVSAEQPEQALRAYTETYLKEEIIAEAVTRKLESFSRFLELAGQFNGKIINFTELARAVGVTPHTAISYFEILEQTLLVTKLPGWSHSIKKQLVIGPRFYFFDCGVLNAIRNELQMGVSPGNRRFGELFESYVVNQLVHLNRYYQKDMTFYHWRTKDNQEVDLICSSGRHNEPIAVEIKSSPAPTSVDFKHLKVFAQDYPNCERYCLCTTPHDFELEGVKVRGWQRGIKEILDIP